MDKKFDLMNPDGFSHFNGPISIIVGLAWGVATGRTNIMFLLSHVIIFMA